MASPISNVRETLEPVATFFCNRPNTHPEDWPAPLIVAAAGMMRVLLPVWITPVIKFNVPFTVMLEDNTVEPLVFLSVRLLKAPVELMVCAPAPFNTNVLPVLVNVPLLMLQLPPSVSAKLPDTKVPFVKVKLLKMRRIALAVLVPVVEIVRLP